jgi:hypothetical protein
MPAKGIVHFAGVTYGSTNYLCSPSISNYLLFKSALPLYLSIVKSFHDEFLVCPFRHNQMNCDATAVAVRDYHVKNGSKVRIIVRSIAD